MSASGVTLTLSAVLCVVLGLVLSWGWEPPAVLALENLRRSLRVTGGAVLFGAGLLHMSLWRLDQGASRAYAGAALVVLGLLTTLTSGTGTLLHLDVTAATLNPITTAWAALASLGLVVAAMTVGTRSQEPQLVRPSSIAAGIAVATVLALGLVAELRQQMQLDVPLTAAAHIALELSVAAAWLAAAVHTHHRTGRGQRVPGLSAGLLGSLALLWTLRAAAVTDVSAWGVASAALLVAVAVVALTGATSDFVDATEAEQTRAEEAERAVVSAAHELQQHDDETRSLNHDARNMLLALRTACQTLADYGDGLGADVRHDLERAIAAEATKLDELISDRARVARRRCAAPVAGRVPAQRSGAVAEAGR